MPDLEELRGFDPGLGWRMPPADEIRRLGDRRRRRRTALAIGGGVLAVALALGTPVLALHGDGARDLEPAPSPAPTPITRIPDGFPIATAFPGYEPDGDPVRLDTSTKSVGLSLCDIDPLPDDGVADRAQLHYTGGSGDETSRALLVYGDDDDAHRALIAVQSAAQDCADHPSGDGSVEVTRPLRLDLTAEESFAYSTEVTEPGGPSTEATVTELQRVGNALLVEWSRGPAGGRWSITTEASGLRRRSMTPLAAMCVFSVEPCSSGPTTRSDEIPEDFPLGAGLVYGAGESMTGPSATIVGVSFAEGCPTGGWPADTWPGLGASDRLAVRLDGAHHDLVRELVTFEDSSRAADTMTNLATAVAGCPGALRLDVGPADPHSLTFGVTDAAGGSIFRLVRVGHAVLATEQTGALTTGTLAGDVPPLADDDHLVTDEMCAFTNDGC
jgi:hypothetical protein